jgi:hypothetical protein
VYTRIGLRPARELPVTGQPYGLSEADYRGVQPGSAGYHTQTMLRVVLALLAVALYIYFIIDVARTPREQARTLPKWLWLVLVIVLPLVGGALWLLLGRTWPQGGGFFRRRGPIAPDDDPRFLRKLDDDVWSKKMRRRRGEPS